MMNTNNNKKSRYYINHMKIDNNAITTMLADKRREELFLLIFAMRNGFNKQVVSTTIEQLCYLLRRDPKNSRNVVAVRKSLTYLIDNGYINIYTDFRMANRATEGELLKTTMLYIQVKESGSDMNYTLIHSNYFDRILYSETSNVVADLLAISLLISRNIERRTGVLPIDFHSIESMCKEVRIKDMRFAMLLRELKDLKVIYFETILINGRKRNIYGMGDDVVDVVTAIENAFSLGKINRAIKNKGKTSNTDIVKYDTDDVSGNEFLNFDTARMNNIANIVGLDLNESSAVVINDASNKHGSDVVEIAIVDMFLESIIDNPTGYLIKMLDKKCLDVNRSSLSTEEFKEYTSILRTIYGAVRK